MSAVSDLSFTKLGENNYKTWSGDMQGKLMEKRCWGVVSGKITKPVGSLDEYALAMMEEQAAGIIWSGLDETQKPLLLTSLSTNSTTIWHAWHSFGPFLVNSTRHSALSCSCRRR